MDPDLFESQFPVAVLCARCGRPDCAGCTPEKASQSEEGPSWEQSNGGASLGSLWRTAHRSVVDGEAFFSSLRDGTLGAAFSFALACELLAVGSLVGAWACGTYFLAPELVESLWYDDETRGPIVTALALSVPGLASMMVLLHLIWGAGVELGLRLQGEPVRLSHGLRYALYSCGWDLLTSPMGLCAATVARGPAQGLRDVRAAIRVPRAATRAFLTGARRLTEEQARRAVWTGAALTGSLVVLSAALILLAAVILTLG